MRVLWISKASVTASFRRKIALLHDMGVEVGVVTGQRWEHWPFESSADDAYPIFQRHQVFSGRNHLHWYRGLNRVIREFRPDLIHIDEEHYSVVTTQAVALAKRHHIPFIFQSWQNIAKHYPFPFSAMEQYVFRHARAAVAGNEEVKHVLQSKGFDKRIDVIGLGVDTRQFFPREDFLFRRRLDLEGRWLVGYIGRLVPEKGVMDVLEAVAPLLQSYPSMTCVVAGSGPLEGSIRQYLEENDIAAQVRVLAWVKSEDMPRLMNALDVLVVPSRTTSRWKEQFGRVIIEAMAVGTPVIGSNSGEIPRVIGDGGLIVPEGHIEDIRDAVLELFEDTPRRHALGLKGHQRVQQYLSQEHVAKAFYHLYQDIMKG